VISWPDVVLAALIALLAREWFMLGWPRGVRDAPLEPQTRRSVNREAVAGVAPGEPQNANLAALSPAGGASRTPRGYRVGAGAYRGDKT